MSSSPPMPPSSPPLPPSLLPPLYQFSQILLSSCGTEAYGYPTFPACQAAYQAAGYIWANNETLFSMSYPPSSNSTDPAWQKLTLPQAGLYTIVAAGASGLQAVFPDRCRGAMLNMTVFLPYATTLYVMVGRAGAYGTVGPYGGGGGGGTFVLLNDGSPLLIAGGGGGGDSYGWQDWSSLPIYPGCDASFNRSGNPSSSGVAGGINGSAGDIIGGAGLLGQGSEGYCGWSYWWNNGRCGNCGIAALNGGGWGSNCGGGGDLGGFGGGARKGGGGGYSGGGGIVGIANAGGGGGSFCLDGQTCAYSHHVGSGFVRVMMET